MNICFSSEGPLRQKTLQEPKEWTLLSAILGTEHADATFHLKLSTFRISAHLPTKQVLLMVLKSVHSFRVWSAWSSFHSYAWPMCWVAGALSTGSIRCRRGESSGMYLQRIKPGKKLLLPLLTGLGVFRFSFFNLQGFNSHCRLYRKELQSVSHWWGEEEGSFCDVPTSDSVMDPLSVSFLVIRTSYKDFLPFCRWGNWESGGLITCPEFHTWVVSRLL